MIKVLLADVYLPTPVYNVLPFLCYLLGIITATTVPYKGIAWLSFFYLVVYATTVIYMRLK